MYLSRCFENLSGCDQGSAFFLPAKVVGARRSERLMVDIWRLTRVPASTGSREKLHARGVSDAHGRAVSSYGSCPAIPTRCPAAQSSSGARETAAAVPDQRAGGPAGSG